MSTRATALLFVLLLVPSLSGAAVPNHVEKHFRLGIQFYGLSPSKTPDMGEVLGAGVELPFSVDVWNGLGFRVAFLGYYHRDKALQGTWAVPDANFQPTATEMSAGRAAHNAFYSFVIAFQYELVVPDVKAFRILQPYVGVGGVGSWLYNYYDVEASEGYLIMNEYHDLNNDNETDMYSLQNQPAFTVYGGAAINVSEGFSINLEVGGVSFTAAEESFQKATDGFNARHPEYAVSAVKWGGGFTGRF